MKRKIFISLVSLFIFFLSSCASVSTTTDNTSRTTTGGSNYDSTTDSGNNSSTSSAEFEAFKNTIENVELNTDLIEGFGLNQSDNKKSTRKANDSNSSIYSIVYTYDNVSWKNVSLELNPGNNNEVYIQGLKFTAEVTLYITDGDNVYGYEYVKKQEGSLGSEAGGDTNYIALRKGTYNFYLNISSMTPNNALWIEYGNELSYEEFVENASIVYTYDNVSWKNVSLELNPENNNEVYIQGLKFTAEVTLYITDGNNVYGYEYVKKQYGSLGSEAGGDTNYIALRKGTYNFYLDISSMTPNNALWIEYNSELSYEEFVENTFVHILDATTREEIKKINLSIFVFDENYYYSKTGFLFYYEIFDGSNLNSTKLSAESIFGEDDGTSDHYIYLESGYYTFDINELNYEIYVFYGANIVLEKGNSGETFEPIKLSNDYESIHPNKNDYKGYYYATNVYLDGIEEICVRNCQSNIYTFNYYIENDPIRESTYKNEKSFVLEEGYYNIYIGFQKDVYTDYGNSIGDIDVYIELANYSSVDPTSVNLDDYKSYEPDNQEDYNVYSSILDVEEKIKAQAELIQDIINYVKVNATSLETVNYEGISLNLSYNNDIGTISYEENNKMYGEYGSASKVNWSINFGEDEISILGKNSEITSDNEDILIDNDFFDFYIYTRKSGTELEEFITYFFDIKSGVRKYVEMYYNGDEVRYLSKERHINYGINFLDATTFIDDVAISYSFNVGADFPIGLYAIHSLFPIELDLGIDPFVWSIQVSYGTKLAFSYLPVCNIVTLGAKFIEGLDSVYYQDGWYEHEQEYPIEGMEKITNLQYLDTSGFPLSYFQNTKGEIYECDMSTSFRYVDSLIVLPDYHPGRGGFNKIVGSSDSKTSIKTLFNNDLVLFNLSVDDEEMNDKLIDLINNYSFSDLIDYQKAQQLIDIEKTTNYIYQYGHSFGDEGSPKGVFLPSIEYWPAK
ncbi:MAG: hypothetical protein K6G38_05685 [Gammaproteobacteria bacterium]|nr:hypothetical protein [Gammaproteobacteria bacterium]